MIESLDAGCSARLNCHDAVGREFDVLHFASSDLLSLNLARTRDRRLRTIREWQAKRMVPYVKCGRLVYFDPRQGPPVYRQTLHRGGRPKQSNLPPWRVTGCDDEEEHHQGRVNLLGQSHAPMSEKVLLHDSEPPRNARNEGMERNALP